MSFVGGSLRLALKKSLAETSLASKPSDKANAKRKKKKAMVDIKKKRSKQIRQRINQDSKREHRKNIQDVAAACRQAQQNHLGIKSTTSEKHIHRMSSLYGKGSKRSNRSISSSSSLSSSSSSSDDSDNDSDSSSSNSTNSSSSSSAQRNMFDTSSSDEMDIDDGIKDSSDNSDHIVSERSVAELMRSDPPSACPKHLLITPSCIMDDNYKPKKRKQDDIFSSYSTLGQKEKKIRKNEDSEIQSNKSKKPPRSTICSASDRSVASRKSSSSIATRRAKSRTCSPPSIDVLRWIDSMSASKSRRNICAGTRVKVRFVTRSSGKDDKKFDPTRRRVKWYGGCVSEVFNDGRRVRIHYDDGTSEVSDFPDDDVVVDDTENGSHKKSMKAFIPPSVINTKNSKNKFMTSTSQNPVILSDEKRNDSIASSATSVNEEKPLVQESFDEKESELLTAPRKVIHKEKLKEQFLIDSTNDRVKQNSELHVSPPSTKASTVTESSFSLSSNNNSANEYSESSCSIASHELISTSSTKKIEPLHSPPHNNFEQLGEQNDRLSPTSEPVTVKAYPKIKISSSLHKTEKVALPIERQRHLIRHSTSPTFGENCQEDLVSKINSNLSKKLDVNKMKTDVLQTFPYSTSDCDKEDMSAEIIRENKSNEISVRCNLSVNLQDSAIQKETFDEDNFISHSQETGAKNNVTDEVRRPPVLSIASKISPIPFEKEKNINRGKEQQTYSDSRNDSLQESSSQSITVKEFDMKSILNLNSFANFAKTHEKNSNEQKQFTDLVTNTIDDERKNNFTLEKSLNEGDISSSFSSSPESTPCKTNKTYDSLTSLSSKPKLSSMEGDVTEPPGCTYEDNLNHCDSKSLEVNLANDENLNEKNSPALFSRSGRLAAQKANRRIASKQEEIVDEFVAPKRKRDRLETRKSPESTDLPHFDDSNGQNLNDTRELEDAERWVQCDRCLKWRLLPKSVKMDKLPEHWYCELNIHDPLRDRCDAPEQTYEEISNEKKEYDISRLNDKNKKHLFTGDEKQKASCTLSPYRQTKKNGAGRSDFEDGFNSRKNPTKLTKNLNPTHIQNRKSTFITQPNTVKDEISSRKNSNKISKVNTRMMPLELCGTVNKDLFTGTGTRPKNQSRYRGNRREQEKTGRGGKSKNKGKTESQEWVQCEKCEKWRKLPPRISAKDLPEKWFCHMNTWDLNSASCAVAEDKLDVIQNNTVSSRSTLRSSGGGKLSYRNLIFGTGKRNLRYTSERARATESLFSQISSSSSDQLATLAYSGSSAFVSKQSKIHEQNQTASNKNHSFLTTLTNSKLWDELYGLRNSSQSSMLDATTGLCKFQNQCIDPSFPEFEMLKDLVYSVVGPTPMNAHQLCLAVQYNACFSEDNNPRSIGTLCTIDRVFAVLDYLVREGHISKIEGNNIDVIHSIRYFRVIKSSSTKSRCMKISKPWKHTSGDSREYQY